MDTEIFYTCAGGERGYLKELPGRKTDAEIRGSSWMKDMQRVSVTGEGATDGLRWRQMWQPPKGSS